MAERYIKKDKDGKPHLFKEGIIGDEDLGELHKNMGGGEETSNIISKNYKLGEKSYSRNTRDFIKKNDNERGVLKEPDFFQSITGDKHSTYERKEKSNESSNIFDSFFGTKKPSKSKPEISTSEPSRDYDEEEVECCPYCGEEYDGFFCENCDTEEEEEYEESEEEKSLRQRREKEEAEKAEKKRKRIEELNENDQLQLTAILISTDNQDQDIQIAAVNLVNKINREILEYTFQYNENNRVREVAKNRLLKLGLSVPPDINFDLVRQNGAVKPQLAVWKLNTFIDTNSHKKAEAQKKLKWALRPTNRYLLTYKCSCCGYEWDQESFWEKPTSNCPRGCSKGYYYGIPSLHKVIIGVITKKEQFGGGELVKTKDIWEDYK